MTSQLNHNRQQQVKRDVFKNQSQNSLLENLCQGNHEAGAGQKRDVGVSVPVIPGYPSPHVPGKADQAFDDGSSTSSAEWIAKSLSGEAPTRNQCCIKRQ